MCLYRVSICFVCTWVYTYHLLFNTFANVHNTHVPVHQYFIVLNVMCLLLAVLTGTRSSLVAVCISMCVYVCVWYSHWHFAVFCLCFSSLMVIIIVGHFIGKAIAQQ